jgi:hypothetical protein
MAKSSEHSIYDSLNLGDGFDESEPEMLPKDYFKHDDAIAARAVRNKQIDYDDFYALQSKSATRHVALYDGVISGKIKVV